MKKYLLFTFIFALILSLTSSLFAGTHSHRKVKNKKFRRHSYAKAIKTSRYSRKSRRFHHGTGPDIKAITSENTFKGDPNNGINTIESTSI